MDELKERFLFYTRKGEPTECWLWQGPISKEGPDPYGKFTFQGKGWRAHKASMTVHGIEIPKGHIVRHKCGNTLCVNPDHLEILPQRVYKSLEKRFWAGVDKRGPNDCWEWTKTKIWSGYGRMLADGKMKTTHRISYELHIGPIPGDKQVNHTCHNRACVNPAHLYLGTQKDNMDDMRKAGRQNNFLKPGHKYPWRIHRGEDNARALLTWDQVRAIRKRVASGEKQADLTREYGLKSRSTINAIIKGKIWKPEHDPMNNEQGTIDG